MRQLLITILFFSSFSCFGQAKRAFALLEKGKHVTAFESLSKIIEKDSLASVEKYTMSTIMLIDSLPYFNIDSSYYFINQAIKDYDALSLKELEKVNKNEYTRELFLEKKGEIETLAFSNTMKKDSEYGYLLFLDKFPNSILEDAAIELRNAASYRSAKDENTYASYQKFFKKYPNAIDTDEAKTNYERLLFEAETRDGLLTTYSEFLINYPNTYHRHEVEGSIYKIRTGANTKESYFSFIQEFPKSLHSINAIKMLSYRDDSQQVIQELIKSGINVPDSLMSNLALTNKQLFASVENGKYNIFEIDGKPILSQLEWLPRKNICSPIEGSLVHSKIEGNDVILNLNGGYTLYSKQTDKMEYLGNGYYRLYNSKKVTLIHASGISITEDFYDDIKLIGPYIGYKSQGKWGLLSTTGTQMLKAQFDNLSIENEIIMVEKGGLIGFYKADFFIPLLDQGEVAFNYTYDDYEMLKTGNILVYHGDKEGMITNQLEEVVPLLDHQIIIKEDHLILDAHDSIQHSAIGNEWMKDVDYNKNWVVGYGDSIRVKYLNGEFIKADSAWVFGNTAVITVINDSLFLNVSDTVRYFLDDLKNVRVHYNPSKTSNFFSIKGLNKTFVYNNIGGKVFDGNVSEVQILSKDAVRIKQKKTSIIKDAKGNVITTRLDGANVTNEGYINILNNGKFGLYSFKGSTMIPTVYDEKLEHYNDTIFIAKQNNYGLISISEKSITTFDYEQIKYWNDTSAMAMINSVWRIIELKTGATKSDGIIEWNLLYTSDTKGGIYSILKGSGYGIYSTAGGVIVKPTFNYITNIGSEQKPIFRAEKFIDEAELYIFLYYDEGGKLFKKEVLNESDYDLLICDDD